MIDLNPAGPALDLVLNAARRAGVSIYGAGGFARAVARSLSALDIRVVCFVVQKPSSDRVDGIPVLALDQIDANICRLPMWIGVFNREPLSDLGAIARSCKARLENEPLLPQHYFELLADSLGWRFWLARRDIYRANAAAIARVFSWLDDDASRQALASTIAFRLGQGFGAAPQPCSAPQYFPDLVLAGLSAATTFVDGGAYDGDTLIDANRRLRLERAYAFEPDPGNFRTLAQRCAVLTTPVTCFPCGLSDTTATLPCQLGEGEACSIRSDGPDVMPVACLDECLPNSRVDFLKLDVEGHEIQALRGAQLTIRRWRPVLAVAGYHLCDDLWKIPDAMRELHGDYRIAYRTHAHNTFDSVFYAY